MNLTANQPKGHTTMTSTYDKGYPRLPEHVERGLALTQQWEDEDAPAQEKTPLLPCLNLSR